MVIIVQPVAKVTLVIREATGADQAAPGGVIQQIVVISASKPTLQVWFDLILISIKY